MSTKKEMNLAVAVVILIAFAGLIFISVNNTKDMYKKDGLGDTSPASEESAKSGDMVAMAYTGRLEDGTVFDSNMDPAFGHVEPFIFTLGAGQVIPGWDRAIVGMKVGDKKTITVSPEEAYGAEGVTDPTGKVIIPPNATLVFDVELLAIKGN